MNICSTCLTQLAGPESANLHYLLCAERRPQHEVMDKIFEKLKSFEGKKATQQLFETIHQEIVDIFDEAIFSGKIRTAPIVTVEPGPLHGNDIKVWFEPMTWQQFWEW